MNNNEFPDALPPEYRLHWYVLQRVLGQGGFGITYVARDTNLDSTVAIKEFLPVDVATRRPDASVRSRTEDQAERYRGGLERFIREARTLARFDHPNIVRVHSVFEHNGTAYMVMRFEEGETLASILEQRHSISEAEMRRILLPILDGLELVHGAGFIHRDIKPDNILIRTDGSPVLLDFGSARNALGQSRTVTILVAPGYAPIEQYYDSGESQGPWTDIYGLGATCYRAIAGHAPLDAIARSKGKLGSTEEMLLPARVAGEGRYSGRLLAAIDKALEFSERDRPQSIGEWRRMLSEEKPAPALAPAAPPGSTVAAHGSRAPWVWAAGGAAAVLVGAAVVSMMGRKDAPDPAMAVAPKSDERVDALRKELAQLKAEQTQTQTRLSEMAQKAADSAPVKQPAPASAPPKKEMAPGRKPDRQVEARPETKPEAKVEAKVAPKTEQKAETKVEPKAEAPTQVATALPVAPLPEKPSAPVDPMVQLRAAADRNDPAALVRLGDKYLKGDGLARSEQEAARLYLRAAEGGSAEAQARLGELYARGQGVPKNNFQAYVWYSAAARGGSSDARAGQDRAARLLQPAEIQQARKLVDSIAGKAK